MTSVFSPQVQQKPGHFINSPRNYQKCHVANDMKRMKNDDEDSSSDASVGSDIFVTFYYTNTLIF